MTPNRPDPREFLPLNPLEFRILLALRDGSRHGYAIVKDVERRSSDTEKIFPANLYRRIRNLLAAGLVTGAAPPRSPKQVDDRQRKFFRLTPLGLAVARAEMARLEELLSEAREKDLVPSTTGPTR